MILLGQRFLSPVALVPTENRSLQGSVLTIQTTRDVHIIISKETDMTNTMSETLPEFLKFQAKNFHLLIKLPYHHCPSSGFITARGAQSHK